MRRATKAHSRAQIAGFFEDLELVPAGLVDAATWRPEAGEPEAGEPKPGEPEAGETVRPDREAMVLAGVGRRV